MLAYELMRIFRNIDRKRYVDTSYMSRKVMAINILVAHDNIKHREYNHGRWRRNYLQVGGHSATHRAWLTSFQPFHCSRRWGASTTLSALFYPLYDEISSQRKIWRPHKIWKFDTLNNAIHALFSLPFAINQQHFMPRRKILNQL